jgi:hypothetical protein
VKSLQLTAIAVLAILAAACGGTSATPAGQPATAAPATSAAGPTAGATAAGATAAPPSAAATTAASVGVPADLCSLLTAAEISSLTGKKYEAGFKDSVGSCNWNVGPSQANSGDLIIAALQPAELALIKSTFPGGVDATVNGHAGYWNGKQGLGTMWVDLGGGQLFTLSFPRSADLGETDRALAQRLAEIAVGKM